MLGLLVEALRLRTYAIPKSTIHDVFCSFAVSSVIQNHGATIIALP
jgi:hypothetical protein